MKCSASKPVVLLSYILGLSGFGLLLVALLGDIISASSSAGFGFRQIVGTVLGVDLMAFGAMICPRSRKLRQAIGVSVVAGLAMLFAIVGLFGLIILYADTEKGSKFRYDSTTGPQKVFRLISRAGLFGTGVCRCSPTKTDRLDLGGNFKTFLQIYDAGGESLRPGVVLIHGNIWLGQNLSTYRFLATLLAAQGFVVLTYDQLGFGTSDDKYGLGPEFAEQAPRPLEQVDRAVQYLLENYRVDPARLYIMGHSYGVDVALPFASARRDVAGVVLYVAPPLPPEPTQTSSTRGGYFANRGAETYQFIYGRPLPDWVTWSPPSIEMLDPWKPYEMAGHSPVIVLLGENDQPRGHDAVKDQFDRLVEPKAFVHLSDADHYANTAQSLGVIFYDRKVAQQLRKKIIPSLDSSSPRYMRN